MDKTKFALAIAPLLVTVIIFALRPISPALRCALGFALCVLVISYGISFLARSQTAGSAEAREMVADRVLEGSPFPKEGLPEALATDGEGRILYQRALFPGDLVYMVALTAFFVAASLAVAPSVPIWQLMIVPGCYLLVDLVEDVLLYAVLSDPKRAAVLAEPLRFIWPVKILSVGVGYFQVLYLLCRHLWAR
ncbi:MAG TPA: hypothetical protein VF601_15275 [Beijerinckiaceae bacterium]|jgi:hypothetical protein